MPASQPLTSGATPALLGRFQTSTVLARVREILSVPRGQVSGRGLLLGAERGFKAVLVAGLAPDRALWVTDDLESAYRIRQDLKGLLPGHIIETFPGPDALEGHILPLSWQEIIHRVHTVMALIGNSPIVVIVPLSGLFSWTLSPSRFRMECQTLVPGVERSLADLIKTLIRLGYQRVSNTQTRGEFSVRGGILDLFCPHEASPVRLEFFGDEIDEIRIFDPVTQRSRDLKTRLELVPARELILDEHELETIDPNQLSDDMGALLQSTLRDGAPKGSELLLDWLPQQRGLIEDHLGEKGLLIWDATPRAVSRASGLLNSAYPEGHVDSVLRVVERCQLLAFAPSPRPVNPLPVIELGTEPVRVTR